MYDWLSKQPGKSYCSKAIFKKFNKELAAKQEIWLFSMPSER